MPFLLSGDARGGASSLLDCGAGCRQRAAHKEKPGLAIFCARVILELHGRE